MVVTADSIALFEQARQQGPNPFKQKPIVSKDEVWGEVTTDLPSLNEHVDTKIHQAISDVRDKYTSKIGIVVKGDIGTGKSHVIHRIRKTIENQGGCIFSYIPPYSHASRINSHVRLYLALSLNERDGNGVTQWQKLAVSVFQTLKESEFEPKYRAYLEKCSQPEELRKFILSRHKKNELVEFFDEVVEAVLENKISLDFNFLKASLFLLLKTAPLAQIGLAWMIGEDFPGTKEAGLPEFSSDQQDGKSVWFIQQIAELAEVASCPVLICFDQLDSPPACNDSGDSPAMVVAKCIDQLYFQCRNVVLLCCAVDTMWQEISSLGSGIPERVGQWSVSTKPPTADQMVELVRLRLNWFYCQKSLDSNAYSNLYPFNEQEVRNIALKAAGSRDLMKWCAEKFEMLQGEKTGDSDPVDLGAKRRGELLDTYKELLQRRMSVPMEDDDKLAATIATAMRMLPAGGTANVTVTDVQSFDAPSHDLHFTITGYDSSLNREVKVGVRVCQTKAATTFNAVMKRLLNYKKHKLTRGCLVRSAEVSKSWKIGFNLKTQLENEQGGEVVLLKRDEIKPLVVIQRIYEEAGEETEQSLNGFSKQAVIDLVKELRLVADNPLICEILSAPTQS